MENGEVVCENETDIDGKENDGDEGETQSTVRRSSRQREKTKRLTYPELGNLLMTIVQTLLQSLSTVITKSFVEPRLTLLPEPKIV